MHWLEAYSGIKILHVTVPLSGLYGFYHDFSSFQIKLDDFINKVLEIIELNTNLWNPITALILGDQII